MKQQKRYISGGFSLVETVIAITIICIVSFAALTTMLFIETKAAETDATYFFVKEVSNLLQCYKQDGFITEEGGSVSNYFGEDYMQPQSTEDYFTGEKQYTFFYTDEFAHTDSIGQRYRVLITLNADGFHAKVSSRKSDIYEMDGFYKRYDDYGNVRINYFVNGETDFYRNIYCNGTNFCDKLNSAFAQADVSDVTVRLGDNLSLTVVDRIDVPVGKTLNLYLGDYSLYNQASDDSVFEVEGVINLFGAETVTPLSGQPNVYVINQSFTVTKVNSGAILQGGEG